MFNFFKTKEIQITAPVNGQCLELESVPDKMFSNKLLGDGLAFTFEENFVCSPIDGKIEMIAQTKHALGIKGRDGLEIMIHIGLDTVELNGEGFQLLVEENQKVKAGQKLIKIDREYMDKKSIGAFYNELSHLRH
ncbi:PTS sugar transporter subunit IIA [Enterococcus olivae]